MFKFLNIRSYLSAYIQVRPFINYYGLSRVLTFKSKFEITKGHFKPISAEKNKFAIFGFHNDFGLTLVVLFATPGATNI